MNYDIPRYPTKRLRYFNNQFLNAQDFIDDQAAHLAHEQIHLRALCVAGICEGLVVTFTTPTAPLGVDPGAAIDGSGRLIVLDAAARGPSPSGLVNGDYVLHIRYNEVASDPSTSGVGTVDDTRWRVVPLIGATVRTAALPAGAIALASFRITGNAIANGVSTAGRQYSGVRLPGTTATLTPRAGSDDGAVLGGTLTVRRDASAAIGPLLTLTNGNPAGATGAGGAIDFNPFDPGANAPALRIQAIGDGLSSASSDLAVFTKAPGSVANSLVERLRITSAGEVQCAGAVRVTGLLKANGGVVAQTSRLSPVTPASVSTNDAFFTSNDNNELYWRNHGGTNIKLTAGAALNLGGRIWLGRTIFKANATYNPTPGTTAVLVRMVGGGGGGGGGGAGTTGTGNGSGGGSGAYVEFRVVPGSAITGGSVTVGAGGAGGANTGGTGGTGASTTISINATSYTAMGGTGGIGHVNSTTSHGPQVGRWQSANLPWADIQHGADGLNGVYIAQAGLFWGGAGGGTPLGSGGGPVNGATAGRNASGFGGGGGGASANADGFGRAGGAGGPGVVIIDEWT